MSNVRSSSHTGALAPHVTQRPSKWEYPVPDGVELRPDQQWHPKIGVCPALWDESDVEREFQERKLSARHEAAEHDRAEARRAELAEQERRRTAASTPSLEERLMAAENEITRLKVWIGDLDMRVPAAPAPVARISRKGGGPELPGAA